MNSKTPNKPLVIAHRGFTKQGLENTLPAIDAALRLGVDGIEVDLRMTRDGVSLVFHDETLERLAGLADNIEKAPYDKIKEVRIHGEKIPRLEELLDLVQDRCLLNLEIKTVRARPIHEQKLAKILQGSRLQDSILLSSFNPLALLRMRRFAPEIHRGFLYAKKSPLHSVIRPALDLYSLHGQHQTVQPHVVDQCHRRGKRFFVWTVNTEDDMNEMIRTGVDGIITDFPDLLLKVVAHGRSRTNARYGL